MAAILGYSKEEMLGRSCFDFIDPEEREWAWLEFQELVVRKILNPEPREVRARARTAAVSG
jgi:PAS domain S-box-containing protein